MATQLEHTDILEPGRIFQLPKQPTQRRASAAGFPSANQRIRDITELIKNYNYVGK